MCRLQNNHCDESQSYNHKVPVLWRKGEESRQPVASLHREEFIPFTIDQGGHLKVFWWYPDNGFVWGKNIPPGKYQVVLSVEGTEATQTEKYLLDWYGNPATFSMKKT